MIIRAALAGLVAAGMLSLHAPDALAQDKEIRWGTSAVGSTGHRAVVNLAELLNRELDGYQVIVQPTPGAIISVKGYATGQFEGYYGSDIAFYELANDTARFAGFKSNMTREPLQSMWTFTVEVGLGVAAENADTITKWADLDGKRVFTGPRPWDTRAQIERAMATLGIEHEYVEVDLSTAGSLLEQGRIDGIGIYANAESGTAPWITEMSIGTDWKALNPSAEELETLEGAGFRAVEVSTDVFRRGDGGGATATLLPFYYGLHVGIEVPEDDVYRMLKVVEANAGTLAETDPGFAQVRDDMVGMQRRGIESSVDFVRIHPGLARYMREKGEWDSAWDDRVASATQ